MTWVPRHGLLESQGFTLLEVMIALCILGLSMTVIMNGNIAAINMVDRIDGMTQATLLARGKMLDIERQLLKEGFKADDEELKGEFDEEGHKDITWTAKISPVKVQMERISDLVSSFSNLGPFGGSGGGSSSGSSQPSDSTANADPMALLKPFLEPVITAITDNTRVVELKVFWPEGKRKGSFTVAGIITSKALQQGQAASAPAGQQPGTGQVSGQGVTPAGQTTGIVTH